MNERAWDVFVSYGHGDAEWVTVLAANLYRADFRVFFDEWEVVGGDRFVKRLEEGLRNSTNGVLVVSPHALSRPWVREEYEVMLRAAVADPARRLIPVLLADAELPPFLGNRDWVDFRSAMTGPAYDAGFERLVRALQGRPPLDRPDRDSPRQWPTGVGGASFRPAGPMALRLRISGDQVAVCDGGAEVTHRPAGLRRSTVEALAELRRLQRVDGAKEVISAVLEDASPVEQALAEVGRRLTIDVLAGPAGAELASRVAAAERLNEVVELGIEIADPGLADLPWETLWLPGLDGSVPEVGGTPLVLHRNVAVYRSAPDLGPTPAHKIRGPLRILAVIGSPEANDEAGELLDYEAELARIVAVVDSARHRGGAYVRILRYGTLAAIHAALKEDEEGFHVLHVSCHAEPGRLLLEREDGSEDAVDAARFWDEVVPAGAELALVVLSGCSTGLRVRQARRDRDDAGKAGESVLASFARQLLERGAPQVLAMQAPISDAYATELTTAVYDYLATADVPDVLVALAEARRACERTRVRLSAGSPRRRLVEWATPALLVRGPRLPLFARREPFGSVPVSLEPVLDAGVVVRRVGEFVGRRRAERDCRRILTGAKAGLVIHGIGGVGKSSLAAELIRALGPQAGVVVSKAGALGIDGLLDEVGARLRVAFGDDVASQASVLRRADEEWVDRWRVLAELAAAVPMVVLLDNFEDNLVADGGAWRVRDAELAAFLAGWVRQPGRSRLLFTCRYAFELPGGAHRRLGWHHLGPLSAAETAKLMWRLPGLDALSRENQERAWRDVGGHPRTLEYLDALLRGGQARFDDVAERMELALVRRGIHDPAAWMTSTAGQVDVAVAEAVTLAVDDVVLGELLAQLDAEAVGLVVAASVYRVLIDEVALVWQVGSAVERAPDPERQARLARVRDAWAAAAERLGRHPRSADEAGLSAQELAQYEADVQAETRPPVEAPEEWGAAVKAAEATGLLAPVARADGQVLRFVHRWTAAGLARLYPRAVEAAHRKAARYWRWRVDVVPQSRQQDIEQLVEARYHHHAAGEVDEAVEVTGWVVSQLDTWGQYGREAALCEQTLDWVLPGSEQAAAFAHQLGILAQARGDYETAEARYRQSLEINERLGNQAGMATSYGQLGILAQARGNYETAEARYRQSLEIKERLGNQAGMAASYHQLGILAQARGNYETAEARYRQSLEIDERLGNQAGMAASYHQLGILAQDRGNYETAEARYRQSLEIDERLGNQAGMAASYHQLGILAQDRGNYETAEARYRQSLEIDERLGNQAGMAASYHQLGILAQDRGDY
ncbi:MAG: tetratricopeptide repeat protein, partial [Egibacteraceae bacterium]